MKVLFIKPEVKKSKKIKIKILNFYNNFIGFEDISAFFEASLRVNFRVERINAKEAALKKDWINNNFDFVVVDYRADFLPNIKRKDENIIEIGSNFSIKKILLLNSDKAGTMPSNNVLDVYDLIFKREPFKDLNKYNLSDKNKQKICTTMISCPFIRMSQFKVISFMLNFFNPKYIDKRKYEYDVFFSGPGPKTGREKDSYKNRLNIWQRVKEEKFNTLGGLISREGEKYPQEVLTKKLKRKEYLEAIRKSKICLAVDGVGEFTYRHLELLQQGAFMLTPDSIKNLKLPIKIQEGADYIAFSSLDDMVNKMRYYLSNDGERELIASNGKKKFDKYYKIKKHGEYIEKCIKKIK